MVFSFDFSRTAFLFLHSLYDRELLEKASARTAGFIGQRCIRHWQDALA